LEDTRLVVHALRSTGPFLLAAALLACAADAAELFGGKGLVAYWSFDEASGGVVRDHKGGDNDGTLQGAPMPVRVGGPFGARSLAFAGPGGRISGSDRGFPAGSAAGSISLWFSVPASARDMVLFCYGSPERGKGRGLWLVNEKRLCFFFWGHPGDLYADVKGGVAPDRWHHTVATYDGRTARLYFDGEPRGEKTTDIDTRLRHYLMGENLVKGGKGFAGLVDEVIVLDRAVSSDDVRACYRERMAGLAKVPPEKRVTYARATGKVRRKQQAALQDRLAGFDFDEIIFAIRQPGRDGHWYANFSHHCEDPRRVLYGDGGRLVALNVRTGATRTLLGDPKGGVRDPQMHYEGRKILFSYRKGGQPYYHLYEIGTDGSGLRRLTDGPFDDFEPAYLPDGGIVFCSSRVKCNVPCYYTRVAVLYRCDADGSGLRRLSANLEHENTPWVLPDGRVLYQRWEYVDRSQVKYHHLWTTNPDGTGQMVYYGNMHGGDVFLDAKAIPGSGSVVMIRSPGHGRRGHEGFVEIVDPGDGPDRRENSRRITPRPAWRDPYPLSEDRFLVAGPGHHKISLLDARGGSVPLFTLGPAEIKANMWVHEPRAVRGRKRERLIPSRVDLTRKTGTVVLQDVYIGRNMKGVKRGEIRKLLVLEILHMPTKPRRDWQQMVSFDGNSGGSFQLERVLGTVPVEEDGSAHFRAPAVRPLFFVALDGNDMSVKRMQSFMTVQPGETVSCIGCHEDRVKTPKVDRPLKATSRPPSRIEPVEGIPDVFDYPRDIQPILDRHCVGCHGYEKTRRGGPYSGKVMLSGDRGIFYNQSYAALRARRQVADGFNGNGNRPPRAIGTSARPLMKKIAGAHNGVKLPAGERKMIHYWIESAGTFAGTYAALGKGFIFPRRPVVGRDVHKRRCAACHRKGFPTSKDDPRTHWLYNLDDPAKSVVLLAPLAKGAGGWGMCRKDAGKKQQAADAQPDAKPKPVFRDTSDPDYLAILAEVRKLSEELARNKRYDMPGFEPHPAYTREMKFFGILPADFKWSGPDEMYRTDEAYWRSLHYRPAAVK
jgi:mono/diheme cytochrome c family protein